MTRVRLPSPAPSVINTTSALSTRPLLIAHRGDTLSFPENTFEAFESAFAKGSDGVELDIHWLAPEIIVVHNFLFDTKKTYPRLREVLERCATKGRIEIEIKEFSTDILAPLKVVLDDFPQADIELTTSETPLAIHIKEFFPTLPVGLIFADALFLEWMSSEIVEAKIVGWGRLAKANVLHVPFRVLDQFGQKHLVDSLHAAEFVVHTHIPNTEAQFNMLTTVTGWGVDQCTVDNLALCSEG